MSRGRLWWAILIVALVVEHLWLYAPAVQRLMFPPREDAAAAGRRVAERLGCFSCHGPEASGGFENPGSDNRVVPALAGGEMMMWADSEQELRRWILEGRRHAEPSGETRPARSGYDAGQGSRQAVVMPAFERHLRAGELELLLAYLRAISGLQFPEDPHVRDGLDLAIRLGCFRCHGPMGTGGVSNPGSLKGYVPGFSGEDYAKLVVSDQERREWIENGISQRFLANPLAREVIKRQAIKMPAYGKHLDGEQIDRLDALVAWLADGAWRDVAVPARRTDVLPR